MSLMAAMRVSVNQACNLKMVHSIIYKAYHHLLQGPVMLPSTRSVAIPPTITLLTPNLPTIVQSCGFKVKGVLKRRCKDCYFVMRQERLYVICKTHPRHKQMSMKAQEKKSWILSHVSQGPVRAW